MYFLDCSLLPLDHGHCLQRLGIITKVIAVGLQIRPYSPSFCDNLKRGLIHFAAALVNRVQV